MTNLESNLLFVSELSPRILRDEIKSLHIDYFSILRLRVIAIRHIDDIAFDVFLDHKPRATTQAQALTLTNRVKPIAIVLAYNFPGLQFHNLTGALS